MDIGPVLGRSKETLMAVKLKPTPWRLALAAPMPLPAGTGSGRPGVSGKLSLRRCAQRWPGQIIGRDTQVIVARVHARAGRLAMATTDPAPVRKDLEAAMISGVSARGRPPPAILDCE